MTAPKLSVFKNEYDGKLKSAHREIKQPLSHIAEHQNSQTLKFPKHLLPKLYHFCYFAITQTILLSKPGQTIYPFHKWIEFYHKQNTSVRKTCPHGQQVQIDFIRMDVTDPCSERDSTSFVMALDFI